MCILCDHETLELLTTPLEQLAPGQLANAIRTAREAAGPGVLDHAETVLRGEVAHGAAVELYADVIVARALEAGVLKSSDAYGWATRLSSERGQLDPRVQAFVSSCAEILDDYRVLLDERRQVLDRFLEAHNESVAFAYLGQDGELWLDYQGESFAVLTEGEAMEIVERELSGELYRLDPETLLRYTTLPDAGLELLEGILAKPEEVASSLLSGLIDLPALADDRVRAEGFAPFFRAEAVGPVEDLRFGEWIVIRMAAAQ